MSHMNSTSGSYRRGVRGLGPVLATGLAILFSLALSTMAAVADPPAAAGGHDIGELMEKAGAWVDLSRMDAVILLQEISVEVLPAGGRRTTVHEII